MENKKNCMYCQKPGRVISEENDVVVCDKCNELLKDPKTALPLIRGCLSLNLRGVMNEKAAQQAINKFMAEISTWAPKKLNKN